MAIRSLKTNSFSRSLLVGNAYYVPPAFDSIATVSLSSGQSSVEFTSISGTYSHLQLRYIARNASAYWLDLTFNSDTGSNYSHHVLAGNGSTVSASGYTSKAYIRIGNNSGMASGSNIFSGGIIDILDYTSTTKNKTVRSITAYDANGSGFVEYDSGLWFNSTISAITSLKLTIGSGNIETYSRFALYGIKA